MITIKTSLCSILYMEDLIKKAEEYDIDFIYLIIDAISRKDGGDYLNNGISGEVNYGSGGLLKKGDAVQA
ncbi:MAG: hypothetical protein JHC33_10535 [Ignisphaera sp.]|nr:hypothetical protein [Ignisphaera sp.]